MKSSTPVGSPCRRIFMSKEDLISIEDNPEDIEKELRNRRLDAINKSTEQRRKSAAPLPLAGLNAAQLAEHCKNCIKLSSENKINSKNAFSFLLIDFMAAMTKKSDSEISKNFQVASCTLDASVKIYGYRVDAVHTETIKIAGGILGRELQDVEDEREDGDVADKDAKGKPKKKKKKTTVVASSTLNSKSESETLLDSMPRENFLASNADNNLLLKKIPKYNDSCLLMVESDVPCWPCSPNERLVPEYRPGESFNTDELMNVFRGISVSPDTKFCDTISGIEFGKDVDEDDASEFEMTNTFEFDVNAEVANASFETEAQDEGPIRLTVPAGGYNSGDEIALPENPLSHKRQSAGITDMKRRLSTQTMEYSMFDEKLLKTWAGPTYWKVRPSPLTEENKENQDASKPTAAKRTRRGKVKEPIGLFDMPEETLLAYLEPSEKTVLAKSTVAAWKSAAFTLAEDYKFSVKQLFTLFHLPLILVEPRKELTDIEDIVEAADEMVQDEGPREELEYCSSMILVDEDDGHNNKSAGEDDVWDAENMVAVPNKVQKIIVSAFQRRKHVDIKHLKRCIWRVLTDGASDIKAEDGSEKKEVEEVLKISKEVKFRDLLFNTSNFPKNIVESMSAPLMFNALLHLTNERCLALKQEDKRADFLISQ